MPAKTSSPSTAAPLLIAAFGLVLIVIVVLERGVSLLYRLDGQATVGTVLYSDYARDTRGLPHSNVTYTFTLEDRRTFKGHQTGYSGQAGERIRIEYLAHHPWISRVAGSEELDRKRTLLIGGAGLLFMIAGIHSFMVLIRRRSSVAKSS